MLRPLKLLLILTFGLGAYEAPAQESALRSVELELESVNGATAYELEFKSTQTPFTKSFKTRTPKWRESLPPGQYQVRMRSYDQRKVPGPWSESLPLTVSLLPPTLTSPTDKAVVLSENKDTHPLKLQWKVVPGAKHYRVSIKSLTQEWVETTTDTEVEIDLPVARTYQWTVEALQDKSEAPVAKLSWSDFEIKGAPLDDPEIENPIDAYISEVKWQAVELAEKYSLVLLRKLKNGRYKSIHRSQTKETGLQIPLKVPGGEYLLKLRAEAAHRQNSKVSQLEFELFAGDRSPASVQQERLKASLLKPTPWYALASYFVTSVSYTGTDSEKGRNEAYDAVGGTGRIGLGYTKPDSPWGGLGVVDMSGYNISGEVRTYSSVEVHGTWQKFFGSNLLRLSSGLFYKEALEARINNPKDNSSGYQFDTITYMGPHAGADYWKPLSPKWGLQFNARLYLPFTGSPPNGGDIEMIPSYHLGVLGSYKISKHLMGLGGYAYRNESISYTSNSGSGSQANEGDLQEVETTGHYLNLMLEWSF